MTDTPPARDPVVWARLSRQSRGPRPSLTHEQIARAAVEIADADGLHAVSMRKVADRLGMGTMSLYRYVSNKDELLELMEDHVVGEALPGEEPAGDWREEMRQNAWRQRAMMLRHPWSREYGRGRTTLGPNVVRTVETMLGRLDRLGLSMDEMLDLTSVVDAFVVGFVQSELAEQEHQRRTGMTDEQWRQYMAPYVGELLEGGRNPYLRRIVLEAEDYPDMDEVFERRLGYVLDGLQAGLLGRHGPSARRGRRQ